MDLNDVFGQGAPGGRPNHPDFWKLSEILLKLDSDLDPSNPDEEAKERQWLARIEEVGIDRPVLTYSAVQRAYRVLGIQTAAQVMAQHMEIARLASVWMEGFAAGTFYEREHGL